MKSVADLRFVEERVRFGLRHTCEACVHFDARAQACAHGYPTAEHRDARYVDLRAGDEVVFCKEWESR